MSMNDLALHIRQVLRLPLVMDVPTPGKGNCFFAAVVQQLNNRLEFGKSNLFTAASLRKLVCEFALEKDNVHLKELAEQHDANAVTTMRTNWAGYFANMRKNGVYAEGPVVYVTALFLQLDIAVISFGNKITNPYMFVSGHGSATPAPPPIFLGNQVDLHFQSFLPDGGVPEEELMMLLSSDVSEKQMSTPVVKDVGKMKSCASLPPRKRLFSKKKKNLRGLKEVGRMGDAIIGNVGLLVTENRRLHALVRSLEFQLSRCTCEGPIEVKDEDVFDVDAVSDDVLASTPL